MRRDSPAIPTTPSSVRVVRCCQFDPILTPTFCLADAPASAAARGGPVQGFAQTSWLKRIHRLRSSDINSMNRGC